MAYRTDPSIWGPKPVGYTTATAATRVDAPASKTGDLEADAKARAKLRLHQNWRKPSPDAAHADEADETSRFAMSPSTAGGATSHEEVRVTNGGYDNPDEVRSRTAAMARLAAGWITDPAAKAAAIAEFIRKQSGGAR